MWIIADYQIAQDNRIVSIDSVESTLWNQSEIMRLSSNRVDHDVDIHGAFCLNSSFERKFTQHSRINWHRRDMLFWFLNFLDKINLFRLNWLNKLVSWQTDRLTNCLVDHCESSLIWLDLPILCLPIIAVISCNLMKSSGREHSFA